MDRILSFLGWSVAISASLVMPLSAYAYLTPDQVFGNSGGGRHAAASDTAPIAAAPAPPTQREGEDVIAVQQQRAAEQRREAQQDLRPVDAPPVDTYVPDQTPVSRDLFDPQKQYEIRQQRKAEQNGNGPTIIIGGDTTVTDSNGNVLHSGAPLVSSTGPATILAVLALILAALCTFAYAQVRSRLQTVPV